MTRMKIEDAIGFGVIFMFIALAWTAYEVGTFGAGKAMLMAITGVPLGLLAPICLSRESA